MNLNINKKITNGLPFVIFLKEYCYIISISTKKLFFLNIKKEFRLVRISRYVEVAYAR